MPGASSVRIKQRLAGVDLGLADSAAKMGVLVMVTCMGGGGCADNRDVLHCGGSGGARLWVGVVGRVPTDWEGAG